MTPNTPNADSTDDRAQTTPHREHVAASDAYAPADAPAPKLLDDAPHAHPDLIDSTAPLDAAAHTDDEYVVAARGPFAGIARVDLAAPAALFHVAEHDGGDGGRYVEVRHRDAGISVKTAESLANYFTRFYDLDHPDMKPGVLVAVHENLRNPDHGGPHITEASAMLGPKDAQDELYADTTNDE